MSTGYQIYDQTKTYYFTFQIVEWVDIFSRKEYRDIIINSINHCRKEKGLEIWAYVIMTNHIHIILSSKVGKLSDTIRDFKSYSSKKILESIKMKGESRREWMLQIFSKEAEKRKRKSEYQLWSHENHAIEITSQKFLKQKMAYIHLNPVRSGLVEKAEDWIYSSQRNFSGLDSILEIDLIDM